MPGAIPGWRQVFADDFNGARLDPARWRVYNGAPMGDPGGFFDPAHVEVANGMLVISAWRDPAHGALWATGGISSSPGLVQTYGKYLVRLRFERGEGISHAILLWPASDTWPPEIDFSEDNGANRQTTYATLHWSPNEKVQIQRHVSVDLTQWHTVGVEWTPGKLVYTLDGRAWASLQTAHVPATPMVMDIQTQGWPCRYSTWEHCPGPATPRVVRMYVDWAVAYARG